MMQLVKTTGAGLVAAVLSVVATAQAPALPSVFVSLQSVPAMALLEVVEGHPESTPMGRDAAIPTVEYTMRVVEVLKTDRAIDKAQTIKVVLRTSVADFPTYPAGQRLILLLDRSATVGTYIPFGGTQGAMPIERALVQVPAGVGQTKEFAGERTMGLADVLAILRHFYAVSFIVDFMAPPDTMVEWWQKEEAVVFGEVVSSEQRMLPNDKPIVVHQLRALEIFKNDGTIRQGELLSFAQYGGEVFAHGRLHVYAAKEFPVLVSGERVVLFMNRWPAAEAYSSTQYSTFVIANERASTPVYTRDHIAEFKGRVSIPLAELLTLLRSLGGR